MLKGWGEELIECSVMRMIHVQDLKLKAHLGLLWLTFMKAPY